MVSLARALADDLLAALEYDDGAPRTVLLWLDPDSGFTRLREAVAQELVAQAVDVVQLDAAASQVELKLLLLETEANGGRAIVHLPDRTAADFEPGLDGRPPALWSLVEYLYKGAVWGHGAADEPADPLSLDRWLESRGVRYSGGGARAAVTAGGADSKLARYVARKVYLDPEELPRPINSASISPAGDPRDRMIELLLDPADAMRQWGESRPDVLELAADTYEIVWAGDAPAGWARQLAIHLSIADCWLAAGKPADYPFIQRVPRSDKARSAVADLIRQGLLPRADVLARVRALVRDAGTDLGGLSAWSVAHPGLPVLLSDVLDARVAEIAESIQAALALGIVPAVDAIRQRLAPQGAVDAIDPRMALMTAVVALADQADAARSNLEAGPDIAAMANAYAGDAWQVDAAWLRIAEGCREHPALAPVRSLASRIYARYVDAVEPAVHRPRRGIRGPGRPPG